MLDVSADLINEVRNEIAADRKARNILRAASRAQANAEQSAEKAAHEAAKTASKKIEELIVNSKNVGKIGLVTGGMMIVGYCVYKAAPQIRRLWKERNHTDLTEDDEE